jgi:hypothetical protein
LLFGIGGRALTRIVKRLLVRLCEVAQLLELRLEAGPNVVDESSKLFLGHLSHYPGRDRRSQAVKTRQLQARQQLDGRPARAVQ